MDNDCVTTDLRKHFSYKMSLMSAICALLVITIHVCNIEVYEFSGLLYWIETFISLGVAEMAVPFFFLSSAFFQFSKERSVKEVYLNKLKTVVVPYLLWNCIYLIAFFVLKRLGITKMGMESVNLKNILEGVFFFQYNLVFWFMYQLILLNLLYPVFRFILKKGKIFAIAIDIILIIIFELFGEITFYQYYWILSLSSVIYFFTGAIIGEYYRDAVINSVNQNKKIRVLVCMIAVLLFLTDFVNCYVWHIPGVPSLKLFKNFALITALFMILDCRILKKPGRLSNLTFMIYAMHSLILESVEKIIYLLLPHTPLFAGIDYFLAPVITLLIICTVCMVMNRYVPSLYGILSGNRRMKSNVEITREKLNVKKTL